MKKKVTIYDVAEAADVSLATVSRVINGSNVVKPATRERVLETIKRLDFKPNQIARGLATSKTTTIAVVFPQSLFGHVKDMIGGIVVLNREVDAATAKKMHGVFLEIIIAPSYTDEALEILTTKKKNLRILELPFDAQDASEVEAEYTGVVGGLLVH